ncbi:Cytochrome oxidase assembly protein SHY1 [Nakaseomyces bracarensis]|uniref:SURF1-like protein n=1 Tax=Nakaseomyces bracarensis TaxID=273131 RepID=A0ABR4NUV1_9SACH
MSMIKLTFSSITKGQLNHLIRRQASLNPYRFNALTLSSKSVIARRNLVTSSVDWKPIKTEKTPNEESQNKSSVGKKIALALMIAMPVISFCLGTWQLKRLTWKTQLIAECETKLIYDPINLPKNFTVDMCEDWEYRKVLLKGRYLHEQELFVGPRVKNGHKGYFLFTPFVRSDTGETLLIERGWIAEEKVAPESRTLHHLSMPEGDNVEVVCLIRPPKERGSLQWEQEDKQSRLWQVPDIYDMAARIGCQPIHFQAIYDMRDHHWPAESSEKPTEQSQPWWKIWGKTTDVKNQNQDTEITEKPKYEKEFDELQFARAGVPIGKQPKIDLRNNHLQYLVTWYGLSLLSTIFLVVALKKYRKSAAISPDQLKSDKLKHARKYM